jgi:hypothetical protein
MSSREVLDDKVFSELEAYLKRAAEEESKYKKAQQEAAEQKLGLPKGWEVDPHQQAKRVRFPHLNPRDSKERYYTHRNFLITDKSDQPDDFVFGPDSGITALHSLLNLQFLTDNPLSPELSVKTFAHEIHVVYPKINFEDLVNIDSSVYIRPGFVIILNENCAFTPQLELEEGGHNWQFTLIPVRRRARELSQTE